MEAASASSVPAAMPERSPVMIAAAKAPDSPGSADRHACRQRHARREQRPPAPGGAAPARACAHSPRPRALKPGVALKIEPAGLGRSAGRRQMAGGHHRHARGGVDMTPEARAARGARAPGSPRGGDRASTTRSSVSRRASEPTGRYPRRAPRRARNSAIRAPARRPMRPQTCQADPGKRPTPRRPPAGPSAASARKASAAARARRRREPRNACDRARPQREIHPHPDGKENRHPGKEMPALRRQPRSIICQCAPLVSPTTGR